MLIGKLKFDKEMADENNCNMYEQYWDIISQLLINNRSCWFSDDLYNHKKDNTHHQTLKGILFNSIVDWL